MNPCGCDAVDGECTNVAADDSEAGWCDECEHGNHEEHV